LLPQWNNSKPQLKLFECQLPKMYAWCEHSGIKYCPHEKLDIDNLSIGCAGYIRKQAAYKNTPNTVSELAAAGFEEIVWTGK
jgi:hypothetical protein